MNNFLPPTSAASSQPEPVTSPSIAHMRSIAAAAVKGDGGGPGAVGE